MKYSKKWFVKLGVKKLFIDMTKNKKEGKYCIFNEKKSTYIEFFPETEVF